MRIRGWLLLLLLHSAAAIFDGGLIMGAALASGAAMTLYNYLAKVCYWDKHMTDRLDEYVKQHMYGQHIAGPLVRGLVRNHLESIEMDASDRAVSGSKALALALHGNTGVGKTYLSAWIEKSLFRGSQHVHKFDGSWYTDASLKHEYRRNLTAKIQTDLEKCDQSLFVFVDSHKFVDGVLDSLFPFLNAGQSDVNGVDYSKAIYIFQSNSCGREVNTEVVRQMNEGVPREYIPRDHMVAHLENCLRKSEDTKVAYGMLLHHKVMHVVPFLPLEWPQVRMCIRDQLVREREKGIQLRKWKHLSWSEEFLDYVAEQLPYTDFNFALHGCKDVPAKVTMALSEIPFVHELAKNDECYVYRCYRYHNQEIYLTVSASGKMEVKVLKNKTSSRLKHQENSPPVPEDFGSGSRSQSAYRTNHPAMVDSAEVTQEAQPHDEQPRKT